MPIQLEHIEKPTKKRNEHLDKCVALERSQVNVVQAPTWDLEQGENCNSPTDN